jgi:hypothetical protein
MVCYCCRTTGDNNEGVGNCVTCSLQACDYFAYGHGEDCAHCGEFYCYKHQHVHCERNSLDPLTTFPKTFRKSSELVEGLLKDPTILERPSIALNHGIYLAKKLRKVEMEKSFRSIISNMKKRNETHLTSLTDQQKETFDELFNTLEVSLAPYKEVQSTIEETRAKLSQNENQEPTILWKMLKGKNIKTNDGYEVGKIDEISKNYIRLKKGTISKNFFWIPKYIADAYDGNDIWLFVTEDQLAQKFMYGNKPTTEQYVKGFQTFKTTLHGHDVAFLPNYDQRIRLKEEQSSTLAEMEQSPTDSNIQHESELAY